jgi:DNA-binding MarR family transcriptional regulator
MRHSDMTAQRRAKPVRSEPPSKQKLRLWLRLLRTSRGLEGELRGRLRLAFGTTLPKFDVMAALARKGTAMSMTELSRYLMVSNGNVTGLIDRLVAEGHVVRLPHAADRRTTYVQLSPKGAQLFQAMAKAHEGWIAELLEGCDARNAQIMMDQLDRLSISINGSRGLR